MRSLFTLSRLTWAPSLANTALPSFLLTFLVSSSSWAGYGYDDHRSGGGGSEDGHRLSIGSGISSVGASDGDEDALKEIYNEFSMNKK